MKVAVCAYDFFEPVLDVLRSSDVSVPKVWSFQVDNRNDSFNLETEAFAGDMRAEFSLAPITAADIQALEELGTEVLLVAGYKYKVPIPENSRMRFINTHGSMLPEGRGPWPLPWILLRHPTQAGVTFHEMSNQWDRGDIVLQESLPLHPNDDISSLSCKTARLAGQMTSDLLRDFDGLWNSRKPSSTNGSYWRLPRLEDRTLDPKLPAEEFERTFRAFGPYTLFSHPVTGELWTVTRLRTFSSAHAEADGKILARSNHEILLAIKNGLACLTVSERVLP